MPVIRCIECTLPDFKNRQLETNMNLSEKILATVASLSEAKQAEVLDFVEYLKLKTEKEENSNWNSLSISSAMRGMEDEESNYSVTDLKETY